MIYATSAIESLNATLRKALNPRGHFPGDDAAMKVLYLAMQGRIRKWTRPPVGWNAAIQLFTIYFEGRLPV